MEFRPELSYGMAWGLMLTPNLHIAQGLITREQKKDNNYNSIFISEKGLAPKRKNVKVTFFFEYHSAFFNTDEKNITLEL